MVYLEMKICLRQLVNKFEMLQLHSYEESTEEIRFPSCVKNLFKEIENLEEDSRYKICNRRMVTEKQDFGKRQHHR